MEGRALNQFESDFSDFTGQSVPYEKMGYSSTAALISVCRDAIEIKNDRLYPVTNSNIRHLSSLISRQTPSKVTRIMGMLTPKQRRNKLKENIMEIMKRRGSHATYTLADFTNQYSKRFGENLESCVRHLHNMSLQCFLENKMIEVHTEFSADGTFMLSRQKRHPFAAASYQYQPSYGPNAAPHRIDSQPEGMSQFHSYPNPSSIPQYSDQPYYGYQQFNIDGSEQQHGVRRSSAVDAYCQPSAASIAAPLASHPIQYSPSTDHRDSQHSSALLESNGHVSRFGTADDKRNKEQREIVTVDRDKWTASDRSHALQMAIDIIVELVNERRPHGIHSNELPRAFFNKLGEPLSPNNMFNMSWRKLVEQAGNFVRIMDCSQSGSAVDFFIQPRTSPAHSVNLASSDHSPGTKCESSSECSESYLDDLETELAMNEDELTDKDKLTAGKCVESMRRRAETRLTNIDHLINSLLNTFRSYDALAGIDRHDFFEKYRSVNGMGFLYEMWQMWGESDLWDLGFVRLDSQLKLYPGPLLNSGRPIKGLFTAHLRHILNLFARPMLLGEIEEALSKVPDLNISSKQLKSHIVSTVVKNMAVFNFQFKGVNGIVERVFIGLTSDE